MQRVIILGLASVGIVVLLAWALRSDAAVTGEWRQPPRVAADSGSLFTAQLADRTPLGDVAEVSPDTILTVSALKPEDRRLIEHADSILHSAGMPALAGRQIRAGDLVPLRKAMGDCTAEVDRHRMELRRLSEETFARQRQGIEADVVAGRVPNAELTQPGPTPLPRHAGEHVRVFPCEGQALRAPAWPDRTDGRRGAANLVRRSGSACA